MNKKLFSWKALAGLALLVAMGLTSCQQGTEVDPTDPYGTKTPTKPSVVPGNADLTLQLAVPSDFASLWKSSVKQEVKDAIAKKDEITVVVKTSGMKLAKGASVATNTLTLPDFFGGKSDKIVNLVFDGSFAETKSGLYINAVSLANDVVNITLPGNASDAAYDLTTTAGTAALAVNSSTEAFINKLVVSGPAGKKGLVVGNGFNAARITESSSAINLAGGYIECVENDITTVPTVITAGTNGDANNGVNIAMNGQNIFGLYASNDAEISALGYGRPLDGIAIAKGKTVTLNGWGFGAWNHNEAPYVNEIVGLGNNTDLTKPANLSTLTLGNFNEFKNTASVSNVVINSPLNITNDIFENVVVDAYAAVRTNVDKMTFNGWTDVFFASKSAQITFTDVDFKLGSNIDPNYNLTQAIIDADDQQATVITYWYYDLDANDGTWIAVNSLNDVPKANKSLDKDGATITSYEDAATPWLLGSIRNNHYWYVYIDMLEENIPNDEFDLVINFTNCKVDGSAMTAKNLAYVLLVDRVPSYRIGNILYRWKNTTAGWQLISVKE